MTNAESKRVGILGGMGPEATLCLYEHIMHETHALVDQDHIETIIAILPKIPDRTKAILSGGEDPTPYILQGLNTLKVSGADFAVIACHTSHYFLPNIIEHCDIPLLDLIRTTVDHLVKNQIKKPLLLATTGTIKTDLYNRYAKDQLLRITYPSTDIQQEVMELLYGVNGVKAGYSGVKNTEKLISLINKSRNDFDAVILGCTELSVLMKDRDLSNYVVDPLRIIAKDVIQLAKGINNERE